MCTAALPQGTVYLSNRVVPSVDAPVHFPGGVTKEMVSRLTVELLAGTSPTTMVSVATVGFLTLSNSDGYFDGGVVSTFFPVTTNAFFQIRFETPATEIPQIYDGFLWGASPVFSGSLGDTNTPGVLSGLGTVPLVLAVPRLSIRSTQTNTPVVSWETPTNGYGLFAIYELEQNPDLNETNWTAVTTNSGSTLSPSMFYRLSIK
jgi:hypothetical protein